VKLASLQIRTYVLGTISFFKFLTKDSNNHGHRRIYRKKIKR